MNDYQLAPPARLPPDEAAGRRYDSYGLVIEPHIWLRKVREMDSRLRGNDCGLARPTPFCHVLTRSNRYDPAKPKRTSGDQAATRGGNWLRLPIASNRLEIDQ